MAAIITESQPAGKLPRQDTVHLKKAILDAHGLCESIEPPVGVTVDVKKSKSARAFLFQTVPEEVLLQVAKNKTAKEVWESLKTRYLGVDHVQKARLHTLKSEFEGMRMKDSESIDEFDGKLRGMLSKYTSVGATLEDSVLVRKLLDYVPDRYLQLVVSIEEYVDVDTMMFDEAIGRLKAYEDRLKLRSNNNSNSENSLLLVKSESSTQKNLKASSSSNGKGRGTNHHDRGGRSGGRGHYASECKSQKDKNDESNLTATYEEHTLLISVCGEVIDSLVLLKEEKLNENTIGHVRFGDESKVQVEGKGTILFKCKNGDQLALSDVYHIQRNSFT
ncbi:uncharacterized protein [Rutidosis leptorrhynchoides]|uniref:uncharacterized protein n=1 Tax=Rutidosis leptorrhynchoides TaxID=125765 RepID=UPI003A99EEB8